MNIALNNSLCNGAATYVKMTSVKMTNVKMTNVKMTYRFRARVAKVSS